MPAGKIQLHLHKAAVAVRLFRWVLQFNVGWTEERWPKVITWGDDTYWINWLWFSWFARRESEIEYIKATGW